MRVWAVSDLHTDYKQNLAWCEELSTTEYVDDVLIVAGDVSDDLAVLRATLRLLAVRWARVFFTPGNHDLWTRRGERDKYDSLGKLDAVQAFCKGDCQTTDEASKLDAVREVCEEEGVSVRPERLDGVWIVPLLAWYHASWDREPDIAGALAAHKMMVDFHACRWPNGLDADSMSLAEHFDSMNHAPLEPVLAELRESGPANGASVAAGAVGSSPADSGSAGAAAVDVSSAADAADSSAATNSTGVAAIGDDSGIAALRSDSKTQRQQQQQRPPVIAFSHFLPYQQLLPEKRLLRHPNLAKAVGSDPLAARVAALQPDVHVFGHTHFSWDARLPAGPGRRPCRFVQQPLAYPSERKWGFVVNRAMWERSDGGTGWQPLLVWDGGPTPMTQPYWAHHYAAMQREPMNLQPAPWCCVR